MGSGQLAAHIRRMGSRYRERANLVVQCLKSLPGIELDISATGAGLHLSAIPKVAVDDMAVSNALLAHRIDVPAMSGYCMSQPARTGFVIGFGNTPIERIAPAIRRFSEELQRVREPG
jgi:GntR family transcriptional regulator/MocR family aminotransferase